MPCLTETEIARFLKAELSIWMGEGEVAWERGTVAEIAATGRDPVAPLTRRIDEYVSETGQSRQNVVTRVVEIADRILANRVTFGHPDEPSFYLGSPPGKHLTAEAPYFWDEGDAPEVAPHELEIAINEGRDATTMCLSGPQVDDMVEGLLRWRAAHPDPAPPTR